MPVINITLPDGESRRRRRSKSKGNLIISAGNLGGIGEGISGPIDASQVQYERDGHSVRFDEDISVDTVEEALDVIFKFTSQPPTVDIRISPNTRLYEVGATANITPGARGHLGSNPLGTLTLLRMLKNGNTYGEISNPTPDQRYDYAQDSVDVNQTGEVVNYRAYVEDDQGRSNYSGYIRVYGTYPWYATTEDITTLTKQPLTPYKPTYFECEMVAETDTDKQKADFEANITITGIMFYNTVSGQRERLNGSQENSLDDWSTSDVTHDVQGNTVNYTRYEHTGTKVGSRKLRFYTN